MKNKILLFTLAVITLASCSTAYKTGQTPDDLYYAKPKIKVDETDRYERRDNVYEDRQIRMAVYDRRWRDLDNNYDYNCNYNPYTYGYTYGYYYNPYYYPYPVYSSGVKFVNPKNTTIRMTNLNAYNNTVSTTRFDKSGNAFRSTNIGRYNNSNSNTNTGRYDNYDTRTYVDRSYNNNSSSNNNNNSNSSSSGNSSSGSKTAPAGSVTRPSRGN